jgi:hypothetical protein
LKEGTVILIMIASFLFIKRINLKIHSIITLTKGLENISLIKQGIFFKEGSKAFEGGGNIHAEFVEVVGQKLVQFLNLGRTYCKTFKKVAFFIYIFAVLTSCLFISFIRWEY